MLLSLLKHYLDTDTTLKVFQSVYCFTTSISYCVENYFPRLWGTGISDAIFIIQMLVLTVESYNSMTKFIALNLCLGGVGGGGGIL